MVFPIVKFAEDVFLQFAVMKPSAVLSPVRCVMPVSTGGERPYLALINLFLFLQLRNPVTQAVGKQLGDIISNCLILSLHLLTRKKRRRLSISQQNIHSL